MPTLTQICQVLFNIKWCKIEITHSIAPTNLHSPMVLCGMSKCLSNVLTRSNLFLEASLQCCTVVLSLWGHLGHEFTVCNIAGFSNKKIMTCSLFIAILVGFGTLEWYFKLRQLT